MKKQTGFTLMEMLGVLAVIAILASVATPKIFEAIRDAKVASFVEDINTIRTAVVSYYKDTGTFPYHDVTNNNADRHTLMKNTKRGIAGWQGPYLDKDIQNPFNPAAGRRVISTGNAKYQFDLDGDGKADSTNVSLLEVKGLSVEEAKELSDALDTDGSVESGKKAWYSAGRVKAVAGKKPRGNNVSMLVYLHKY